MKGVARIRNSAQSLGQQQLHYQLRQVRLVSRTATCATVTRTRTSRLRSAEAESASTTATWPSARVTGKNGDRMKGGARIRSSAQSRGRLPLSPQNRPAKATASSATATHTRTSRKRSAEGESAPT